MNRTTLFAKLCRLAGSAAISPYNGCVAVPLSENVLQSISSAGDSSSRVENLPATDTHENLQVGLGRLQISYRLKKIGRCGRVHRDHLIRSGVNICKSKVDMGESVKRQIGRCHLMTRRTSTPCFVVANDSVEDRLATAAGGWAWVENTVALAFVGTEVLCRPTLQFGQSTVWRTASVRVYSRSRTGCSRYSAGTSCPME